MDLIFDCGSTKTDVCLLFDDGKFGIASMQGFNPNYNDGSVLESMLDDLKPIGRANRIFYYGTGCGSAQNREFVSAALKNRFPKAHVEVYPDIMASARALFGNRAGVACILGTGSNSCLYNGSTIERNSVSLGFLLGDEGSGFDIGKKVLQSYFRRDMPADLLSAFENHYNVSTDLIHQIYDSQTPSRFVASFARFACENLGHPFVKDLCEKSFERFIDLYIVEYQSEPQYPIAFSGSVAFAFKDLISECLKNRGYCAEKFIKSPIESLAEYHSNK